MKARALEETLKQEEEMRASEERERIRTSHSKKMSESNEARTRELVDDILTDIERFIRSCSREPRRVHRAIFPIECKRTLSLLGWRYEPILPRYAQDACAQLEKMGYEIKVSIVYLGGGSIGPRTQNGWIDIFW